MTTETEPEAGTDAYDGSALCVYPREDGMPCGLVEATHASGLIDHEFLSEHETAGGDQAEAEAPAASVPCPQGSPKEFAEKIRAADIDDRPVMVAEHHKWLVTQDEVTQQRYRNAIVGAGLYKPAQWNTLFDIAERKYYTARAIAAAERRAREETENPTVPEEPKRDPKLQFPTPSNPMKVARQLEVRWFDENGLHRLKYWRGDWMFHDRTRWRTIDQDDLRARLYLWLEHAWYVVVTKEGDEDADWAPTEQKIKNLVGSMKSIHNVQSTVETPSWLGPHHEIGEIDDNETIISCTNGLLRVAGRKLIEHCPNYFAKTSVPYAYDPRAQCPTWMKFLAEVFPEDPDCIEALQDFMAYLLSGRTDLQKILLLVGLSRSGKGTIARILRQLVGEDSIIGPALASFGTQFGLASFINASVAIVSDARLSGREQNVGQIVEGLLTISGEDTKSVPRKHKADWNGKLPTRIVIISNEPPNLQDNSGTLPGRFIGLQFKESFIGREDPALTDKLAAEMSGILNWVLEGLDRINRAGRLTVPKCSAEIVATMRAMGSPVAGFINECCDVGPGHVATPEQLWEAWDEYATDARVGVGGKPTFFRDIQTNAAVPPPARPRFPGPGKQMRVYRGIAIKGYGVCSYCGEGLDKKGEPERDMHPNCEWKSHQAQIG